MLISMCVVECMRDYLYECIEFVVDFYIFIKIKVGVLKEKFLIKMFIFLLEFMIV